MIEKLKSSSGLPSKEAKLFKKLLKHYDQKKYKKGLKCCSIILSNEKCNKHLETLAMQSLMMYFTGKKNEAIKNIKIALTYDLKSSICWHAYGIIHKYTNSFDESIKCMSKAILFDPQNQLILTELGSLYIHQREYNSSVEPRYRLLKIKSGQKHIWLAYIVSLCLAERYKQAYDICNAFISTLDQESPKSPESATNQYSNILLFRIRICLHLNNIDEALNYLNTEEPYIFDKFQLYQLKYDIYVSKGEIKNAMNCIIELLNLNPNDCSYYELILKHLPSKDNQTVIKVFRYFTHLFPLALYPKLRILQLLNGQEFSKEFSEYIELSIKKGQPNLFSSLKSLYSDKDKILVIESIFERIEQEYVNDPCIVWVMYYLAQHHLYQSDYSKALSYTERIQSHSPTFIDCVLLKAVILKKMGNIKGHIESLEYSQSLDTADRNINSLLAKSLTKYQQLNKAVEIIKIYQFKSTSFWGYMTEVECMWLIERVAKMFFLRRDHNRVISVVSICNNFYNTFYNDQTDFHMYCMRKVCLDSYIEMHSSIPYLKNFKIFFKVCRTGVKACLSLLNLKNTSNETNITTTDFFKPQSLDPFNLGRSLIQVLLSFDNNIKNYFLVFDFYYPSQKLLILTKVLLKMYEYAPKHPRTIYNHIRLLSIFKSATSDEYVSEILSHFSHLFKEVTTQSLMTAFPEHHLSPFYLYLLKLFNDQENCVNPEVVINIFDQCLTKPENWNHCYNTYKEFAYDCHILSQTTIISKLEEKIHHLFPNCDIKERMNLPYIPQS